MRNIILFESVRSILLNAHQKKVIGVFMDCGTLSALYVYLFVNGKNITYSLIPDQFILLTEIGIIQSKYNVFDVDYKDYSREEIQNMFLKNYQSVLTEIIFYYLNLERLKNEC